MPTVKQKYADPRHVPFCDADSGYACELNTAELEKFIAKSECAYCLEAFMQLGRWAETRFYELP